MPPADLAEIKERARLRVRRLQPPPPGAPPKDPVTLKAEERDVTWFMAAAMVILG